MCHLTWILEEWVHSVPVSPSPCQGGTCMYDGQEDPACYQLSPCLFPTSPSPRSCPSLPTTHLKPPLPTLLCSPLRSLRVSLGRLTCPQAGRDIAAAPFRLEVGHHGQFRTRILSTSWHDTTELFCWVGWPSVLICQAPTEGLPKYSVSLQCPSVPLSSRNVASSMPHRKVLDQPLWMD